MMRYLILTLFSVLIFSGVSCEQNSPPPNLIDEDTYISLLVELQLVKSYRESVIADSGVVDSLQSQVYKKYNITKEQFRISHNYYQGQHIEQKNRVDEAIERLRMDHVVSDSASN